jgi:hypothetical protein
MENAILTTAASWRCHRGKHILPILLNSDTKYSDVGYVVR